MDAISSHKHEHKQGTTFVIVSRCRETSNRSRGITAASVTVTAAVGSSTAGNPRLPRYSRRPHHHAAFYQAMTHLYCLLSAYLHSVLHRLMLHNFKLNMSLLITLYDFNVLL